MKNSFVLMLLVSVFFFTLNCGNWWDLMSSDGKTMIIRGDKEIKNETLVLPPGTTVVFKEQWTKTIQGDSWGGYSTLTIGEDATLIAKGTPDEPIVFENGGIIISENSLESIIRYCLFDASGLGIKHSISILNSKFKNHDINLYKGDSIIVNNKFENCRITIPQGVNEEFLGKNIIKYNNISNSENYASGWGVMANWQFIIEYNNIYCSDGYAVLKLDSVNYTNDLLIKYNYIHDSYGMAGVDTNGSQCRNVIFSNYYRNVPVPNAGCGW